MLVPIVSTILFGGLIAPAGYLENVVVRLDVVWEQWVEVTLSLFL